MSTDSETSLGVGVGPRVQILATYREQRFEGSRTFELFQDRVVIKGKQYLGGEFTSTVMLEILQPTVNSVRRRSKGFVQGIVMLLAACVLLQGGLVAPSSYYGGLVVVLGIAGLLLAIFTLRKIEWASFTSKAGVLSLAISRAGKEKMAFDSFIQQIVNRIRAISISQEQ